MLNWITERKGKKVKEDARMVYMRDSENKENFTTNIEYSTGIR